MLKSQRYENYIKKSRKIMSNAVSKGFVVHSFSYKQLVITCIWFYLIEINILK